MRTGEQQGTWSWAGFGVAAAVTVVVLGALEAGAVQLAVQKKGRDVRRGWNLVPVLRFTRDLPDHAVLQASDVETSLLPEQFVTDSVLPPVALARVAGQTVYPQVMKGDVVLRSLFDAPRLGQGCGALVEDEARRLKLESDPAVRGVIEAVRAEAEGAR